MNNTSLANTLLSLSLGLSATFCGLTLLAASVSKSNPAFSKHGIITATHKGDSVSLTVTGIDGWKINTEYNAKVVLGSTTLRKGDGIYKDINDRGDKACSVSWHTLSRESHGSIRLVFCNDVSCTAPIATDFTVK